MSEFIKESREVKVTVVEASRGELLTALSHREIDGVVAAGGSQPEHGDSLVISEEEIFLAVPADHPLASSRRLSWEEVRQATFIVSADEPGPEIHDYILRRVSDLGRRAHVQRYRLGREGIMSLVGLGFGVSLVADHWLGVAYPSVAFVPVGSPGEKVPFSLTWKVDNDNPALRRFISLARIEAKRSDALS